MSEKVLVRKIAHNLWQWREVTTLGTWRADTFYTGDINLLKETVEGRLVSLILPGQDIVSDRLPADISDRRQLLKILPFEVEEFIIDDVDDLHFAYGAVTNQTIPVAYADAEWLAEAIAELEAIGAEVQRVSADYLQLPKTPEGWTVLLENGVVLVLTDAEVGFAVEQEMASAYLTSLAATPPQRLQLYADDQDSLYTLVGLLPDKLKAEDGPEILEQEAGYWDVLVPGRPLVSDFRNGRLARKLPFAKWWQDFKVPLIATAAAFLIALGGTWLGLNRVEAERKAIVQQTDAIFRQVVPKGNISDPERQLRGLLGTSSAVAGGSNVVGLLAGVAPAISSLDEVVVKSFRYTADNSQLQMNVEAKSFTTFETLRSKIAEAGYTVEIKSANVYGDVHQAQIRVSEASS